MVRRKDRTQRRSGLPIENLLVSYPRRVVEQGRTIGRWLALAYRYRAIVKRVVADRNGPSYVDEALKVVPREQEELPNFVQVFAEQIPQTQTHGAPVRKAAAAG